MLTVKKLALSTLITSSLLFYPALHPAETPQHVVKQPAGGYNVQVGDVLVTSFTDGSVAQDLHTLLRRTTAQKTDALLAKNFQLTRLKLPLTPFDCCRDTKFWSIPVQASFLVRATAGV